MARTQSYMDGFLLAKRREGVSDYTLSSYSQRLAHFADYICDREITVLTPGDIRGFLASRYRKI